MYNLSTVQLLEIWTQLEEARAGTHGYGGSVAEIYLYLVMRRNPSLEAVARDRRSVTPEDERLTSEAYREARLSLLHVFETFAVMRDVEIGVEEAVAREFRTLGDGDWFVEADFRHRIHVEVTRKPRKAAAP
jgi:hypothetical protein